MKLDHIKLEDLKLTNLNVRKRGAKDVADILPSIRSLGVLQPLLVRPNCEGYEIVAGQRRYHAVMKLAEEAKDADSGIESAVYETIPCAIMEDGDDAKAVEASLAENIARLPMDEIDQYKAFAALKRKGRSIADITTHFGVTERLVKQRLAIANLYSPILTAYRKDEIGADTVRVLTMATTKQQKAWWKLYTSEDDYAPQGRSLKAWLFGGCDIPVSNALFDIAAYDGNIIGDLFGEERYFDEADKFWPLQSKAIAEAKETYLADGWSEVIVGEVGDYWQSWAYRKCPKKDGGRVYAAISDDGEVAFHEGYITEKEAETQRKAKEKAEAGDMPDSQPARPELTKAMQNYLDLHRHAAVRTNLLSRPDLALRLAVAQIIAGSPLWEVKADPQKANTDAIKDSVTASSYAPDFAKERDEVAALLGLSLEAEDDETETTLVRTQRSWKTDLCPYAIFAKLCELDDKAVNRILTFVVAETLACGDAFVEGLGAMMKVDMSGRWTPDDTFFDLLRDKEVINACVAEAIGKNAAASNVTATAKVQKRLIRDALNGTRKSKSDWQPRYMAFPMKAYTKRGSIDAIERVRELKKHFA